MAQAACVFWWYLIQFYRQYRVATFLACGRAISNAFLRKNTAKSCLFHMILKTGAYFVCSRCSTCRNLNFMTCSMMFGLFVFCATTRRAGIINSNPTWMNGDGAQLMSLRCCFSSKAFHALPNSSDLAKVQISQSDPNGPWPVIHAIDLVFKMK